MGAVDDIFDYLSAQGIVGGTTGWQVMRRRMPDQGPSFDKMVVVAEDGGAAPEIPADAGVGDSAMADLGVLVTVRAGAWDGDSSYAKAAEVLNALHGLRNVVLGGSGSPTYFRVSALTSEPVFVGFDDQSRPKHTVGFRLLTAL